jgi:hypothetical protein
MLHIGRFAAEQYRFDVKQQAILGRAVHSLVVDLAQREIAASIGSRLLDVFRFSLRK